MWRPDSFTLIVATVTNLGGEGILGRSFWLPVLGALGLTALGEAVAIGLDPFPTGAANEAQAVDGAFRILTILAVPVFAFVLSFLIYSAVRFRRATPDQVDGPPLRGSPAVGVAWLGVTTALTLILIRVGAAGLEEIRHNAQLPPDLVVKVEGMRWSWRVLFSEAWDSWSAAGLVGFCGPNPLDSH
ncbi:MAG: hypothetical protein C4315_02905 [Chloroflexota bacterium]